MASSFGMGGTDAHLLAGAAAGSIAREAQPSFERQRTMRATWPHKIVHLLWVRLWVMFPRPALQSRPPAPARLSPSTITPFMA